MCAARSCRSALAHVRGVQPEEGVVAAVFVAHAQRTAEEAPASVVPLLCNAQRHRSMPTDGLLRRGARALRRSLVHRAASGLELGHALTVSTCMRAHIRLRLHKLTPARSNVTIIAHKKPTCLGEHKKAGSRQRRCAASQSPHRRPTCRLASLARLKTAVRHSPASR